MFPKWLEIKLESELNESVVSKDNYLNYSYNDNKKIENK